MNGKFRVWHIHNEQMHYDNYIKNEHEEYAFHINMEGNLMMEWFMFGGSKFEGRSAHDLSKDGNYIVQFFTGLQDKSGKDIYDGDCLAFTIENMPRMGIRRAVVNWNIEQCAYKLNEFFLGDTWIREIIGNIYENPELLKGD